MHRIDTPTAQKDKFGAGKNGFTRGNPQTGTPATDLDDDYFDMLQEELAGIIEAAGIVLDKSKRDQLRTALPVFLRLGTAAKKDIGAGPGQVPDMSSYTSGNGWVRFPDGTTIQRGSAGFQAGINNQYVTLPRAFSSTNFRVVCTWNDVGTAQGGSTAQPAADVGIGTGSKTTTRFGLWQGGPGGFNVDWIAFGES